MGNLNCLWRLNLPFIFCYFSVSWLYHFNSMCKMFWFLCRIILVCREILRFSCPTLLLKQGQLVQVSKDEVSRSSSGRLLSRCSFPSPYSPDARLYIPLLNFLSFLSARFPSLFRSFWIATHSSHALAIPSSSVLSVNMLQVHFVFQFSSLMKRLNSTGPSTWCSKRQHWTCKTNYLGETYKKYLKVNYSLALLNELAENNPRIIYIGLLFTRKLTVLDCQGSQATFINTNIQFSILHIARQLLNRLAFSLQNSSKGWTIL